MRVLFVLLALLALAACSRVPPSAAPSTFPAPTIYPSTDTTASAPETMAAEPATTAPMPAATSSYDGQWREAKPGIEFMLAQRSSNGRDEWLLMTRIDPLRVSLRALYAPDQPKTARDWQREIGADIIINGGFFDDKNRVTGLLISDGQLFGRSYNGFGGMLSWRTVGPTLQWLRDEAYQADPSIEQAVQGFPMLVVNGARVEQISDNGEPNRRSFVAIDASGRLLFGVTQMAQWTLTELAEFLDRADDLNIVSALNLDGGASSGLMMSGMQDAVSMNSFDAVPAVIAVWSRG